ncbi:uncharacterized protein QC761_111976 [Podospora bellae-mahoneyi]|uniref:Secreted protein n=1 Tax=Podospora bellae-mahoneyi TaxID=2093777 RepID=A0ABR0FYU8_9PEZI|nr:hypothetical protein QC761_111976 [Podospora bellae-mahoneyi]
MPLLRMAWFPPCLIVSSTSSLIAAFQLSPLLHFRTPTFPCVLCVSLCCLHYTFLTTTYLDSFCFLGSFFRFVRPLTVGFWGPIDQKKAASNSRKRGLMESSG